MGESGLTPSSCTHVGHGVHISLDWDYHRLAHAADRTILDLTDPYRRAGTLYARLLADPDTLALWDLTGYAAWQWLPTRLRPASCTGGNGTCCVRSPA